MTRILVVGGASLDILHFAGRIETSIGGAGMYTALAARRCGVEAGLFAPKPDPLPPTLRPVLGRLGWQGPDRCVRVAPIRIGRHEAGQTTTVIEALFRGRGADDAGDVAGRFIRL